MKSITFAIAILGICFLFDSCSSPSKITSSRYFGEGESSRDTLYMRATDSPVSFVFLRLHGGTGGSSQDTLSLEAGESARFYRLRDSKKKK